MLDQIVIAICGVVSIYLTNQEATEVRKYACIFGLIAQPFWLYSALINAQWGIVALSFVYAYGWWIGFKTHWLLFVQQQWKNNFNKGG